MKNICVFSTACDVADKYKKDTIRIGKLIAKNKYNLVWGGTNKGLMKITADTVKKHGGKIFGVTMEALKKNRRMDADEMTIAEDVIERKQLLIKKADAIVLLSGGIGGMDEMFDSLELKKEDLHSKPIVLMNTDNFYQGLKIQFKRMKDDGFMPEDLTKLVFFADTPAQAINYIRTKLNK